MPELDPTTYRTRFTLALTEKHGRPMKLANQIALAWCGLYQSRSLSPEEAARAWVTEQDARATPRRRSQP